MLSRLQTPEANWKGDGGVDLLIRSEILTSKNFFNNNGLWLFLTLKKRTPPPGSDAYINQTYAVQRLFLSLKYKVILVYYVMHYVIYNKSDTKDTPNSHIRTGYNYSFTVDKLQVNCDYGQKLYSVITTFIYTLHP